jgi:hypothetical protein
MRTSWPGSQAVDHTAPTEGNHRKQDPVPVHSERSGHPRELQRGWVFQRIVGIPAADGPSRVDGLLLLCHDRQDGGSRFGHAVH